MPYVFTEQGIAMLSAVFKNDVATNVSVNIMRAFAEMRKIFLSNKEMFACLDRTEEHLIFYKRYCRKYFQNIFRA